MAFNDPIAELLTKIRNATRAQHRYVDVSLSKMKLEIIKILQQRGFIAHYLESSERKKIRVFFKYLPDRSCVIHGVKRVSKPGLRRYVGYSNLPKIYGGIGNAIVSTSKGIMVDEEAKRQKVGGELLCYIW
ncbi:MAG: 30S ribosomal protein S8 [Parachlamydiales bacterium]|nr:30S ribosomal protein S8 [Parachlamydiales bacterium]